MDDDQIKEQPKDVQQEEVKPKKENSDEKPKEEKPKRSIFDNFFSIFKPKEKSPTKEKEEDKKSSPD